MFNSMGWLTLPAQPESFILTCADAPWPSTQRMLVIAGSDAKGVLNGVHDLHARVLATRVTPDGPGTARDESVLCTSRMRAVLLSTAACASFPTNLSRCHRAWRATLCISAMVMTVVVTGGMDRCRTT